MHHFRFEHEFDVPPDRLWKLFFDEAFNRELYRALDITTREVLELHDDGRTVRRVQRLTPRRRVPAFVQKLVPDQTYVQCDTYHRGQNRMDTRIEPRFLPGKCDIQGVYTVTPVGEARCRRVFEGDAAIAVPVLGGQLEKILVGQMRHGYDVGSKATNDYIAAMAPDVRSA